MMDSMSMDCYSNFEADTWRPNELIVQFEGSGVDSNSKPPCGTYRRVVCVLDPPHARGYT
ncbi:hypothetical protein AGABI2DRAFT_194144 [Agaricus bisporus var. bisporus H97]|uniref:hypothetical protein n=1 Tax=Agaricus bisporus var. bisporus (strain H97 / ATCC MYA-4626 / FGSC 10389) TaxID=936046 RepID=UPI00029F800A|nr:hypothetical protein AGABI2DRAFT_194144 [Agaricus bisporus var. bisporus H97]EKV45117.1 hypothetical protein AGABI2DRAFT_194144 [Agaricus bisporus var. bisporus H97]